MKKIISLMALSLIISQQSMAENSLSTLQHVKTDDCTIDELKRTIIETAQSPFKDENGLTVIEEGLGMTLQQKEAQASIKAIDAVPQFKVSEYNDEMLQAEGLVKNAEYGKKITLSPKTYLVNYVKSSSRKGKIEKGIVKIRITCTVDKASENSPLEYSARLIDFTK